MDLSTVQRALSLVDLNAQQAQLRMAPRPRTYYRPPSRPGDPKLGGVLVLLYPRSGGLSFVLTRRTEGLNAHRGQISLPGGQREPGETLAQTALREAREELGINLDQGQILGELASLYIPPSDFVIHPLVACTPTQPDFVPASAEVAELFQVPLDDLLEPSLHKVEDWVVHGLEVQVPFYHFQGHKVWGATAMVLSELEQRLKVAGDCGQDEQL